MYDLIVIGAGPGGYVCAIRAAQLGLKVACVEGRETLGGTCLNVGCIPSKALLHASHMLHETHENFDRMGLTGAKVKVDWTKMQGYKAETVAGNTKGIEFLFKKNKIDWLKGWASIPEAGKVKIGDEVHETKNIVIASGSVPAALKGVEVDNAGGVIVDSTGALALPKIPKSMVVIGAGIIGLELGSVYARLGAKVTFVEYLDAIAPGMDGEVQKQFQKILLKQGMDFVLGAAVKSAEIVQGKAKVVYALKKDDSEKTIEADCVLVSTGRRPHVEGLGLDTLGVEMTDRGFVKVNDRWATNIKGLYAIGDCVPGLMLAHKAEDEGIATAEVIAGKHGHVNYDVIPGVIYTTPEVASVGLTEEAAKDSGRKIKIGKFPFLGNARAKAMLQADGFVKMIADAETDRILGCHIVGPNAGEMIHEICVAMEFGASAEDVALTCHAHPTTSEAVREAALACGDGAIHA
ncbi:MAG: dihydrolipoyl dehydrogenase [Paracoccus sp. (in: a-proteobacteria)]|uniref:dihydrolipoyl dehydrogenase n=1 Tax=unclassified Paracoccus (in: a-proteobacteria) TaxID=2688777 RepID=UPI000C579663|nr:MULTISPECIES: dihydrolipoyl dehydrogenase [unclassified Paracoccus (in: a-proteobacteria)]MAN56208.1 dihydrolipoyl dehydrogenase [Paracoccus sp. (in: a-proteobacteria)]MBA49593.1 dihydrolipoyl dehydrogenase [Paracoccus sp. (in: a-proteobacteria)]MDB2552737.1 dihydrolipoyl dehydrogenase [Paracoccus sp. (in: a-proteobacteria)]|tara:strand:+ start:1131 stop:2519 length:1389 start_codon:yes stop_codon:yes gene_type:complete